MVSRKISEITPHFHHTGGTNGQTSNATDKTNNENGDLLPQINSSDSHFDNK